MVTLVLKFATGGTGCSGTVNQEVVIPTGNIPTLTLAIILFVEVSITETVILGAFATYTFVPSGLTATPRRVGPIGTVSVTVFESPEEVVVNGMSPSTRNSPYANSGIVVEIRPEDLKDYARFGVTAGLEFQKDFERLNWEQAGRTQSAPAQRLTDFLNCKTSSTLPAVSYFPGVISSPLHEWIPPSIGNRLKAGFGFFGSVMRGFLTEEAVITGVESRTSSPVRIPRDPLTLQHIVISGLFPCGEGSGYAGGIVSSAVDGMNSAEAVASDIGL